MNDVLITDPRRNTVGSVIDAIARLDTDACTADDVLQAIDFQDRLKQVSKQLGEQLEQAAIKFIQANGPLIRGTVRYYVGEDRKVKCKSVRDTLDKLFEATGGDFDSVAMCLSSDALKQGACKDVLGAKVWGQCFTVTTEPELKEGAAPKPPKLKKFDTRFSR